ncbi:MULTISPECIES: hypothetical protein [Leifsonia]|uniref:Uncharacterized protein n=1 Tax=Leifsonia soli TaxID=582665 RepID=A0A852T0Z7_9MICO|nr:MULTISPECIES: hypothetical protein [Leifsonia]NYD74522.1 hypothetical protein [Leifsonia soli]SEA53306.1 hypothetical protein SAMN04515680_0650 [Leifsonia sp. 21MFCrub1.1]
MDDLHGSAAERLRQLDDLVSAGEPSNEWLTRHLRQTLSELAEAEPVVDAERDRREDY